MKSLLYALFFCLGLTIVCSCNFCISPLGMPKYSNVDSIYFTFKNNSIITKIELIGINKTIDVNAEEYSITLNPADSISIYKVYWANGSGVVKLRNNMKILEDNRACEDREYSIRYNPELIQTTFSQITIQTRQNDNKKHDIEITP